jgi:hypothetical protein
MKLFAFAATLAAALAAVTAAAPAAAVLTTFATYSAVGGANIRFVNSGTSAGRTTDATYYTTATPTSTVRGAALVNFSFINSLIAPSVNNISARYSLDAVVAKNSPLVIAGTTYIQPGISGTFSFLSTAPIVVSGPGLITTVYATGSNLLSGTFSSSSLIASRLGTSGATFASGVIGTTISFTSDFLSFDALSLLDRSTSLTAIAPGSFPGTNGALRTFRAVSGGQFSADPSPTALAAAAVPEPATWTMLLAGFGLVGFSMRRRKNEVAA